MQFDFFFQFDFYSNCSKLIGNILSSLLWKERIWNNKFQWLPKLTQWLNEMLSRFSESNSYAPFTITFGFYFFNFYLFILKFIIIIILLYNIVLVLPHINMNPPQVYTCSPSWTPFPPSSPYHLSGSSQCTSPKHPVSCIEPGLAIHFIYDIIHDLWGGFF